MFEDLVLDIAIRNSVLVPLSVVMVLIGILRYFMSRLMRSSQLPDPKVVKEGQLVMRVRNFRAAAALIPGRSFRARRAYYNNENLNKIYADLETLKIMAGKSIEENGILHVPKGQAQTMQAQMFTDPNMAMDMMKKNLSMIIPQTLTLAWVNIFFSGFVAGATPFSYCAYFKVVEL